MQDRLLGDIIYIYINMCDNKTTVHPNRYSERQFMDDGLGIAHNDSILAALLLFKVTRLC